MTKTAAAANAVDYAKAPVNANLSAEDKIRFLRDLLRIRRFEQTALKFYNRERWAVFCISILGRNRSR